MNGDQYDDKSIMNLSQSDFLRETNGKIGFRVRDMEGQYGIWMTPKMNEGNGWDVWLWHKTETSC
jgi:hypothetical protein